MPHLGGTIYKTIKEAIKMSTGDYGLISTYANKDGALFYFVNGKPIMKIEAPKK